MVSELPLLGGSTTQDFTVEGRPEPAPGDHFRAEFRVVSEDYFRTLGIPLLKGRQFTAMDSAEALPVAIISEGMHRRFWPDENPLGRRIKISPRDGKAHWLSVVGVVGDVHHDWIQAESRPTIYLPYLQAPQPVMNLILRAPSDAIRLAAAARAQIQAVDADQPISNIRTMERMLDDNRSGVRISAALMGIFAAVALALSAAGIYAVMAYSVTQRTHEMGVRIALGAQPRDVLKLVVGQAIKLLVGGLAIGLPAAFALAVVASSLIFGVVAPDALTFVAFTLLLSAVALLASYIPARRASRVDPMVALRYE